MKLQPFALLVVLLVVSSAVAQESCENTRSVEACTEARDDNPIGCYATPVWSKCRKFCDACHGVANQANRNRIAILYGSNHIITWDRLPFDCTGRGEFILYKNTRTGMQVHALFTRRMNVRNSVTTAVAAIDSFGKTRLQIAVKSASSGAADDCETLYWYGEEKVEDTDVSKPGGYKGIRKINANFQRGGYRIDLESGAQISINQVFHSKIGCYFNRVEIGITANQAFKTTGLLGTPNNNIYNDWPLANGGFRPLPTNRLGRYLKPAYDYATSNWCVRNPSGALIYYDPDHLGDFGEYMKCNAGYDGFYNFSGATERMKNVCGDFNYECLQDSLSLNTQEDGQWTNRWMEDAEGTTTSIIKGLNIEPRGILADRNTTVRVTVKLTEEVPNLNGFALAYLNDGLRRTGRKFSFLSDDGVGALGDTERLDNVYSKLISLRLKNGHSRSLYVIPLIKGKYKEDRADLMFALPDAVRGVSSDSGRLNIRRNDGYFERAVIDFMFLEVHYIWPRDKKYVETATTFLNYTTGTSCGEELDDEDFEEEFVDPSGPYLECDCDQTGYGSSNKVRIDVGDAISNGDMDRSRTTTIGFYAVWRNLGARSGSGPIEITVVAKTDEHGVEIAGTYISMTVTPGRRSNAGCAANPEQPLKNLLGKLIIKRNKQRWRFTLEPSVQTAGERILDPSNVLPAGSQSTCSPQ